MLVWIDYLECPCCGCVGAYPDEDDMYFDGQPLICGCSGWVSVDSENEPYINNGDGDCSFDALCKSYGDN